MKKIKRAIVCMMLVLMVGCTFTGCGKKVPTRKDVEKAYEKVEIMSQSKQVEDFLHL